MIGGEDDLADLEVADALPARQNGPHLDAGSSHSHQGHILGRVTGVSDFPPARRPPGCSSSVRVQAEPLDDRPGIGIGRRGYGADARRADPRAAKGVQYRQPEPPWIALVASDRDPSSAIRQPGVADPRAQQVRLPAAGWRRDLLHPARCAEALEQLAMEDDASERRWPGTVGRHGLGHETSTFAPGRLSCREGGELLPWSMCIEDLRAPLAIDYSFCSRFGRRPASSSRSSGTSYDPLSICSRMRRACASNLDGTNSSAGPVGYGPSPAPLRSTGMPSASSRPLTISPSTHDWVQNTDTKSSPTHPSCHHANPQSEAHSTSSSLVAKPPQSVLSRWQGTPPGSVHSARTRRGVVPLWKVVARR